MKTNWTQQPFLTWLYCLWEYFYFYYGRLCSYLSHLWGTISGTNTLKKDLNLYRSKYYILEQALDYWLLYMDGQSQDSVVSYTDKQYKKGFLRTELNKAKNYGADSIDGSTCGSKK